MGFEFGYSLDYPDALVMWEAQFGDFANGAQVIIDQFITSSEDKWKRLSGLVLLLPHGYEGQGPEHSSARLERFLQSCAEHNIQVAQPTTPAQMFHLLRGQVLRRLRKPLIVMTPKSLLRLPAATSPLDELATGTFQRVLARRRRGPGEGHARAACARGKIYYELVEERAQAQGRDDRDRPASRSCTRGGRTWSPRRSRPYTEARGAASGCRTSRATWARAPFVTPRIEASARRGGNVEVRVHLARRERQPGDRLAQGARDRAAADPERSAFDPSD